MKTSKMGIYEQVLEVVSLQQTAPKIARSHRKLVHMGVATVSKVSVFTPEQGGKKCLGSLLNYPRTSKKALIKWLRPLE